jgi:hypothetical protein
MDKSKNIGFFFNLNPNKYKAQIQWFKDLNDFFNAIEIVNNNIGLKYNLQLQITDPNQLNNHLIMRWHTHIGEKETHNVNLVNGSIISTSLWQVVLDIVRDGSISVIEYDTVVPVNQGCVIFSETSWGMWKFIRQFFFKELKDGYILEIKIPIMINNESLEQQWIVTYVKINKIPEVKTKGIII